jgi:hypothetical protein
MLFMMGCVAFRVTCSIAAMSFLKASSPAATMPLLLKARPQHREPPVAIINQSAMRGCGGAACKRTVITQHANRNKAGFCQNTGDVNT